MGPSLIDLLILYFTYSTQKGYFVPSVLTQGIKCFKREVWVMCFYLLYEHFFLLQ